MAGVGVQEPAVRLRHRRDLDHRPGAPIDGGERAVGLDEFEREGQRVAIPLHGRALGRDAVAGVPLDAVRLPRELLVLADLADVDVVDAGLHRRLGVVLRPQDARPGGQHAGQDQPRVRGHARPRRRGLGDDHLRRALRDDLAPADTRLGAEIDDPVGALDHVNVVLDDDDGVAEIDEALQDFEQLPHIVEVQPRRRLVEQVQGLAGAGAGEFRSEFNPLRLAAGHRRGRLAQRHVTEAHVAERLQHDANFGDVAEEFEGFVHPQVQDRADRLAAVLHG